jgi:hypothetical protein
MNNLIVNSDFKYVYFLTLYADYKGFTLSLFEVNKEERTFKLLDKKHSDIVSNIFILDTVKPYLDHIKPLNNNLIYLTTNKNPNLRKYLRENLDNCDGFRTVELDIERSCYAISDLLNSGILAISEHLLKEKNNIVERLKTIDLLLVSHDLYSLFLGLKSFDRHLSNRGYGLYRYDVIDIIG